MSGPRAAAAIVPIACGGCPWPHVDCLIARQPGDAVGLLPFTRPLTHQCRPWLSPGRLGVRYHWQWQACRCKCARSVNHGHTLTGVSADSRGCSTAPDRQAGHAGSVSIAGRLGPLRGFPNAASRFQLKPLSDSNSAPFRFTPACEC